MGDIFDKLSSTAAPAQTQQPSAGGADIFQSLSSGNYQSQSSAPQIDQASQTRQMLVSGLTGMPTPNMSQEDIQQFQQGKAAGAVSVPIVAAGAAGAAALPGAVSAGATALTPHVIKVGQWAVEHPVAAKALYTLVKDVALGAAGLGLLKKGLDIGLAGSGK